tara:strand:+ start:503 stop:1519 length:1017 start_codon:yes stop_codon:yes gene_type:complete
MNYIFIIIIILLILFWVINDLFSFFEFFDSGTCTTNNGVFGNFYDGICHPFDSSTAPSNLADYTPPVPGSESGTWDNTGTESETWDNTGTASESESESESESGNGSGSGIIPLSDTVYSDCIDKKDINNVCKARNNGNNNYGIESVDSASCVGDNIGKIKVKCGNFYYNSINKNESNDVVSATPCLDSSIDFNEACRIYQNTSDLKSNGYNINSIGTKEILEGINGDCYMSDGIENNPNKSRALCSYKYNKNITKLDHMPNNYDYNEYTGCKDIKSDFRDDCQTLLGLTDKTDIYAYIAGYDCLPGFGRAKCIDKKKEIKQPDSLTKFMTDAKINYLK